MVQESLTAIIVSRGKLGALVATPGAVAGLHFELVPGGLPQLTEEELGSGVGLEALPGPGTFGSKIQHQVSDGAAATGPALEVDPCMSGVDVGEQRLVLVEHRLCGKEWMAENRQLGDGETKQMMNLNFFCEVLLI